MFKKKEYKKFIKKLEDNLYEITGDIDVFKEFFSEHYVSRADSKGTRDVAWNLEGKKEYSAVNIVVFPFYFEICSKNDTFGSSRRQFVFKKLMSDDIRGNGLSDYGNYYKQITLKFEFPEKIGFIKTGLINIISVSYKGLNDTVEIECINNIPQYWKYPDSFELFVSEGDCFYSDDENLKRKLWTDNGDGVYSGYIKDISYGELCYYSYDMIGDFIFNKWSNAYQAITDIFPKDCEDFHPSNRRYTVTSLVANIRSSTQYLLHGSDNAVKGRLDEWKDYPFGCFIEYNADDDKSVFLDKINHSKSDFSNEYRMPKDFRFVKLFLKKGNYVPDNLSRPFNVLDEKYLQKTALSLTPLFTGYHPVRIEFLDTQFKEVASIDFDKFGVAKFNDFIKVEAK